MTESITIQAGTFLSNLLYLVLILLPGLYWCVDPGMGLRAMLLTMLSGGLNTGLKIFFQVPRPLWGSALTGTGAGEISYALPSGHAEQTTTAVSWVAAKIRTPLALAAAIALVLTVGEARVLALAHTPDQVILGTLAGLGVVVLLLFFDRPLSRWVGELTRHGQLLLATGSSLLLFGVYPASLIAGGFWDLSGSIPFLTGPLDPSPHLVWTGFFFGIATGAVWTAERRGFPPALTIHEKVGRYLWAVTGLMLIGLCFWTGAGESLPPFSWALLLLGAMICGWWITAMVPALCRRRAPRIHQKKSD